MRADIRWQQRFANFCKALAQLDEAVLVVNPSQLERAGIIKIFGFTAELAWNTLKDYLNEQGINELTGSRDAVRAAFKNGIIQDGMNWMKMIDSRNQTSHIYKEEIAEDILHDIQKVYHPLFHELLTTLEAILAKTEA